jgi:hypothetical protein
MWLEQSNNKVARFEVTAERMNVSSMYDRLMQLLHIIYEL